MMQKILATPEPSTRADLIDPVLFDSHGAHGGYRTAPTSPHPAKLEPAAFSRERSLPVRGRAQGGSDGNFVVEEHPIDWTFRPADLQGVNDAFSVFVSGDSMAPKYKNGDLVYVHPNTSVLKSRFVLVETVEHKGFIKQFLGWQEDHLLVRQFNPAKDIRIAKQDVLRVMLVIGSLDC